MFDILITHSYNNNNNNNSTTLLLYYSTTLLLYYSTTLLLYYSTTLLLYNNLLINTFKMSQYAKNQPEGFVNKIERVAIIGVSFPILFDPSNH